MEKRSGIWIAAVAVAAVVAAGVTWFVLDRAEGDPAGEPVAEDASTGPAYLFAFDGRDAELAAVPGGQGEFTLTVPVALGNELVTWFTDRPVRDAGHMSMASFVDLWTDSGSDSFATDPPNVAISFGEKTVIATMTDPRILTAPDGDPSLETTMTLVQGDALDQLARSGKLIAAHAERAQGSTLSGSVTVPSVSVFVDDSSGTGCQGWTGCCQAAGSVPGASCTITKK